MTNTKRQGPVPRGDARGFFRNFKHDFLSGFLVFLIALPLCLGISIASGYPPLAGVFTAIVGALVATLISDSELTIKGPAAGLIVIAVGCIEAFGGDGMLGGWSQADMLAYRSALAVGVVAAILQILFGVFRAGILGEFFPISAVHGMLAAIGVIIIAKQIPVALGVSAAGDPLELIIRIPRFVAEANPAIAAIGLVSVLIMFVWPLLGSRFKFTKLVPSPLIVLMVAVPMGMAFDLLHEHSYTLQNHRYQLGEQYLVAMPDRIFGMFDRITMPEFSALSQPIAWKWVFMFFIIGSLETLLSAKAVDLIDPWKRKSNMNRDVVAVGAGNLCAAMIGGLPMISEIVRSRANIDNGARTRFANMWHGVLLLVCVALIPMFLHRIPMAALAAMLIYTGFRLAHPREFMNVLRIGREQLVIFCATIIAVLMTDLLVGIAIGVAVKFAIHITNGVPIRSLFKPDLEVIDDDDQTVTLKARESAVFSNWILIRRRIEQLGLLANKNLVLDLSETKLVDHSVMDKLHEMEEDFAANGLTFRTEGLYSHLPFAGHDYSARRKGLWTVQRLTLITDADTNLEPSLIKKFIELGASGFTSTRCFGMGRHQIESGGLEAAPQIRLEVIGPAETCMRLVEYLRSEVQPYQPLTFCLENVQVARMDAFVVTAATNSDSRLAVERPQNPR